MADIQYVVTKSDSSKQVTVQRLVAPVTVPNDAQFVQQDTNLPGVMNELENDIYNRS